MHSSHLQSIWAGHCGVINQYSTEQLMCINDMQSWEAEDTHDSKYNDKLNFDLCTMWQILKVFGLHKRKTEEYHTVCLTCSEGYRPKTLGIKLYGIVLVSKVSAIICFLAWFKCNPVKVKWPFLPGRIAKVCYPKTYVLYMDISIQKYLYSPMNKNKSSQGNVWNYLCATWNKAHVVIFSNQHLLKMFLSLCLTVTLP